MSELFEKLEAPARTNEAVTKARAKLHQLEGRWGCAPFNAKKPPEFIAVDVMGTATEFWSLIGRPAGKDTLYELRETRPKPKEAP